MPAEPRRLALSARGSRVPWRSLGATALGHRYVAALVCGALTPLALAPLSWWPVAIIASAGLCHLLRGSAPRRAFALAWWFGAGLFGVGASWIYVSIHTYGNASAILAGGLVLLFVSGLAAVFAAPFALYGYLNGSHPATTLLAFPGIWVLGEWWRGWLLTGFPWLYLGYGHLDTWLAGWAPVGGVLTLSGMVALCGALLANAGAARRFPTTIGTGLAAVLVLWGAGAWLQGRAWTTPLDSAAFGFALVQPAVPQTTRWDPAALPAILADVSATTAALWRHDLIVWPESAIPRLRHQVRDYLTTLNADAGRHGAALIVGMPTASPAHQYLNSVIALGTARGEYHKRHLVPFGEYVPLEHWLRGIIAFFDLPMSMFSSGPPRQALLALGETRIATAICYEIAYPDLVAADAGAANLLLTVSNDTWFGASLGPLQHLQMAQMRALENGKPLLRATNDGITASVDALGHINARLPRFGRGVLSGRVTPRAGATPFSRWQSRPVVLVAALLCLLAWWVRQRMRVPGDR